MRKLFLLLFCLFSTAFLTHGLLGQNNASATWPLSSTTTTSVVTSGTISADSETLVGTEVNGYTGANGSQRIRMAGTNNSWAANLTAPIPTVYVQFAIAPRTGNTLTISSLSLAIGAASTNTMKAKIYYSTDPTFTTSTEVAYTTTNTSNYLISSGQTQVTNSPNVTVNDGQTFYVRIYPWHESASVATGKYMTIQNVVITGAAMSMPRPASVAWNLITPDSQKVSTTTGSVVGQTETIGAGPNGMKVASYNTNGQRINQGAFGWVKETTHDDTRYVQFNVTPKVAGGQFNITNISFDYGGAGSTNAMNSNVFYSTDNWVTRTQLNTEGALVYPNSTVTAYTKSLNATVSYGQTFSLRIYPYWVSTTTTSTSKYAVHRAVVISGMATGEAQIELPTVKTTAATYISMTTAISGGSITSDGGDPVVARGICCSTTTNPTIANSVTSDGTGTGTFVSNLSNLTPGVKYYIRAYATNGGGTGYGNLDSLTTLAALTIPTVTTTAVSSIAVISVTSGGNVTSWGGSEVLERGVCWNTTGNPSVFDTRTYDGSGNGSFTSNVAILQANTTYYLCAYAINYQGVGYGQVVTFTTQSTAPAVNKVVASDGTGDYTTVQAAFDAVPDNYTGPYTIYIKNGTYKEKLSLGKNKTNVIIKGQSKANTILTYDDYSGRVVNGVTIGTSTSQSVWIQGNDIIIQDITIQNTSHDQGQAVALNVTGDRVALYNCILSGYQDTYYTWNSGRVYHKNCFIEGSVDFIFGSGIAIFDHCVIHERRNGGVLTAASTAATLKYGYVFLDCTITADPVGYDGNPITSFWLGRPWQNSPQTVFIRCVEPATVDPLGWTAMQVTPLLYAEYKCTGDGFLPNSRTTQWGAAVRPLNDYEVSTYYTIANIFSKNSSSPAYGYDWTPPTVITSVEEDNAAKQIPTTYELFQNYPNPFNPSTTIKYSIPKNSFVKITMYDILGSKVRTLIDEEKPAGYYEVKFDAGNLASGIYLYSIQAGDFRQVKKMILMK